jgi:hypothetical protein
MLSHIAMKDAPPLDRTPKLRHIGERHFSLNGERRCRSNSGTLRNFRSARYGG